MLFTNLTVAQNLLHSRQSSYYTFIYKITEKEAEQIYKNDLWEVDEKFFHTLVDSLPTDSTFKKNLPIGHYLKVHTEKNRFRIDITSVQDFDVMIIKNNTDLAIQIYNLNGQIIPDADVSVRLKTIRFDKKVRNPIKTRIFGIDNFGNKTLIENGELPLRIWVNPYYSEYCSDGDSV